MQSIEKLAEKGRTNLIFTTSSSLSEWLIEVKLNSLHYLRSQILSVKESFKTHTESIFIRDNQAKNKYNYSQQIADKLMAIE